MNDQRLSNFAATSVASKAVRTLLELQIVGESMYMLRRSDENYTHAALNKIEENHMSNTAVSGNDQAVSEKLADSPDISVIEKRATKKAPRYFHYRSKSEPDLRRVQ